MTTLRLPVAAGPLDASVTVPGSKSIANRALVCAALAEGTSRLTGLPPGDDTTAMVAGLRALGVDVAVDGDGASVSGVAGRLTNRPVAVDAALAGTTSRFLTAVAALAEGPVTIDGAEPLRRRPMGPLHDALTALGADVRAAGGAGRLPVVVRGPLRRGGRLALPGDVSSQFLTAVMLVGPLLDGGLHVELTSAPVSAPYLALTADVMGRFGVPGVEVGDRAVVVPPGRYAAADLLVEPDASSASYPLAMAAVAGGRVKVLGLHRHSVQGDAAFVDLLAAMGCTVRDDHDGVAVEHDPQAPLAGVEVDLADVSDLVPTVAAVAALASSPTTITGVGFIRAKESDRLGDLAVELRRLGADVDARADGLHIGPAAGGLHGATLDPHHDHRLAMAFGVVATRVAGIEVTDAEVVAKSWPDYWRARAEIVGTGRG